MIPPKIQSIINEYKPALPEYIQEALDSFDWISMCQEISAKYRLTAKQEELFLAEIIMVLFQITDAGLLKANIMNHIGLSEMITHNLLIDVNSRVITRLQSELTHIVGDSPEILRKALYTNPDALPDTTVVHPYAAPATGTSNLPNITTNHDRSNDPYLEPIE